MKINYSGGLNVGVIVLVFIAVVLGWFVISYNSIVGSQKTVDAAWADIEAQLQRRLDLIPNLVNTVKAYATHERQTLVAVTEARAKMKQMLKGKDVSPKELMQAKVALDGDISRLFALMERYPDLKANQNFLALQDQLEGTENRIAVARERYNYAVREYNRNLVVFPNIILAKALGFKPRQFFEAEKKADKPAQVKF